MSHLLFFLKVQIQILKTCNAFPTTRSRCRPVSRLSRCEMMMHLRWTDLSLFFAMCIPFCLILNWTIKFWLNLFELNPLFRNMYPFDKVVISCLFTNSKWINSAMNCFTLQWSHHLVIFWIEQSNFDVNKVCMFTLKCGDSIHTW